MLIHSGKKKFWTPQPVWGKAAGGGASASYTYPVAAGLSVLGNGTATNTFSAQNLGSGSQFVLLAIDITGSANGGITGVTVNSTSLTLIQDDGGHNVTFYAGTVTLTGTDVIALTSAAGAFNFLDINVAPWVLSNLASTTKISSSGASGTTTTGGPVAASVGNLIFMAHNGNAAATYTTPAGFTNRTAIVGGGSGTVLVAADAVVIGGMISGGTVTPSTGANNMFGNVVGVWG